MKYFRVYAGYTKNRPPTHYDYWADNDAKATEVKRWFKSTYPWLDVYKVEEIKEQELSKFALRLYRRTEGINEMGKT